MIDYTNALKDPYFWRRANRENPVTGKAPIRIRIEIEGYSRTEMSTGVWATAQEWSPDAQRLRPVRGTSKEEQELLTVANTKLARLKLQITQAYHNYKSQGSDPSPAELRELLRGHSARKAERLRLLSLLDLVRQEAEQNGRGVSVLRSIRLTCDTVSAYLKQQRQATLLGKQADRAWCRGFERWCLAKPLGGDMIRIHLGCINKALEMAVDEGLLPMNPMAGYKYLSKPKPAAKRHLSQEEVNRLASYVFSAKQQQEVADLFLFCCYTGLVLIDYTRFAADPAAFISWEPDPQGRPVMGLNMKRQKMARYEQQHWAPLFADAVALLDYYQSRPPGRLPLYSPTHINRLLKGIAQELELSLRDLKHKDARSTFSQHMLERYDSRLAAAAGMHTQKMAEERYNHPTPVTIIKDFLVLGAKLTYN